MNFRVLFADEILVTLALVLAMAGLILILWGISQRGERKDDDKE